MSARRQNPFPPELLREPDLPVPPLERRELRVSDIALPSAADDYDFLFSATVRWCPVPVPAGTPPINASGLAVDAILARARALTSIRNPERSSLAQHELNGQLATMWDDSTSRVQALAVDVTLTLADQDRERLAKLAAVRKDEAVWEHERKYEQSRRSYLGDDVLRNTGSAVVWWLHRNDDRIDKTVKDLGLLAQLTSAANDEDVSERLRHLLPEVPGSGPEEPPASEAPLPPDPDPDTGPGTPGAAAAHAGMDAEMDEALATIFHATGRTPGDEESTLLVETLASMLENYDADYAAALRDRFGPAAPPPPHANGENPRPAADTPF
jgi:hypothetical protein